MENLIARKLDRFPLTLKFIVHLEYFDGHLLSLFENEEGDIYLYSWCDVDDLHNRWLVLRVTPKTLKSYIEGQLSLRDLIVNPVDCFLYSLDIDSKFEIVNSYLIQPHNLPELYIPDPDTYYSISELNSKTREKDLSLIQQKLATDESSLLVSLRPSP